jgi:virginiamycin B lyase
MRTGRVLLVTAAAIAAGLLHERPTSLQAQEPSVALSGRVASAEEGPMEGVLVTARKGGSTIAITVVTDRQGRFGFPSAKLEPGEYGLGIRAVGYELEGPESATVAAQQTTVVDLKLGKTSDLASQLTNAEWLSSMPGEPEQKRFLLDCVGCHTLERIARSQFDSVELIPVLQRMSEHASMSTPEHPQWRVAVRTIRPERLREMADYLSTINLSDGPAWQYPLKPHARPAGRATRVIITEYDLPRPTMQPHDVHRDNEGMLWFSDFGEQVLGKLEPRTGRVTEYPIPGLKPGSPTGTLGMEPDNEGNYWLALMYQAGIAKFDRTTGKFQLWSLPKEINTDATQQSMVMPRHSHVDGKVWANDDDRRVIVRLDLASGGFELIDPFAHLPGGRGHFPYGLASDPENDLFFMDFSDENIGRIDAKTLTVQIFPTPTARSRPRRGMLGPTGHLWFAEFAGNRVGMFDTKSERFQEWEVPTPWTAPADVAIDRSGELWAGSMNSDRVVRLDPESGRMTEYLLPRQTSMRKVFVDDSTTPVTFWTGNTRGASIVKVEPLD